MPYITTAESIGIEKGIKIAEEKWKHLEEQYREQLKQSELELKLSEKKIYM